VTTQLQLTNISILIFRRPEIVREATESRLSILKSTSDILNKMLQTYTILFTLSNTPAHMGICWKYLCFMMVCQLCTLSNVNVVLLNDEQGWERKRSCSTCQYYSVITLRKAKKIILWRVNKPCEKFSIYYNVNVRVICALFFLFWPLKNRGA